MKFLKAQYKFEHNLKFYIVVCTGVRNNHQYDVYENEKLIGQHCPVGGIISIASAKNAIYKVLETINPTQP